MPADDRVVEGRGLVVEPICAALKERGVRTAPKRSATNLLGRHGRWAAAAPVTDGRNVVASLSAPCPAFRLDKTKRETIIDLVRKTAADISHALGA